MSVDRLAAIAFVLLWATGFIGARYAMPHAEPFSFLAVRFAIAAALFAVALRFRPGAPIGARAAWASLVAGALMHGVYLGGVFWAVRHGMPAGLSSLLVGLQPIITALLARPLLGEAVSRRQWVALLAGLAGVALVLSPKLAIPESGVNAVTLAACLVAVSAMALGTIWQKRHVAGSNLLRSTAMQYVGGALVTGALALALETGRFEPAGELFFALAWLVLVLSVGAVLLLMILIERGAVSGVASLFYLVPSVTAAIAWPLFGETLDATQIAGMAITAAAVAAATRPPRRSAASA